MTSFQLALNLRQWENNCADLESIKWGNKGDDKNKIHTLNTHIIDKASGISWNFNSSFTFLRARIRQTGDDEAKTTHAIMFR